VGAGMVGVIMLAEAVQLGITDVILLDKQQRYAPLSLGMHVSVGYAFLPLVCPSACLLRGYKSNTWSLLAHIDTLCVSLM
jgi:hypothetical protein